ncbi:hypothetical protein CLV35_2920 [Motilibacter peucedani]|uniref:Excreted virulence factor EspC (Type VII ESX diderm) n=1 Tax=Motilibacter peucedani TaxID=598650 RepID=A0A420XN29_9ACTN|nr:hypothetical protein [Motilibacter peucedani]RKS72672.1 hypothetical protein CLV35_2920 [Motilibacter peucedani]
MSDLRVDSDVLLDAASAVRDAPAPGVQAAGGAAPGEGAVGHADLAGALSAMSAAWKQGVTALDTDTTRAGDGLRANALRYVETDLKLQEQVDRIRRGLPE